MGFSQGSILHLLLLLAYVSFAALRSAVERLRRADAIVLGLLVAICVISYLASVRFNPNTGRIHIHHWDVYHYFIGTKYFAELGYEDLYRATAIADFEDDRANFQPQLPLRDLRNNAEQIPRSAAIEDRSRIEARFSDPARWSEFKGDIAFFRSADPQHWRASRVQLDHGYNGSPLTTALLGFLANHSLVDTPAFLQLIVWADLALTLLLALAIALTQGASLALGFLFFWFLNPFNDYEYLGGSFLRYNHFLAAALGIVLYQRGRLIASGASFAAATLFRLFPLFFVAGLLLSDLIHPDRRPRLRSKRRFYLSYLASTLLILAATAGIRTPDAEVAWVAFAKRITTHASVQAHNVIGLKYPFMYSHEYNMRAAMESQRRGQVASGSVAWSAQRDEIFREREPFYLATAAALLALAIAYIKRTPPGDALFLGILGAFLPLMLAHYYYCMLSLIPLIFPGDRRIWNLLGLFMVAVTAASWIGPLRGIPDLAYLSYSLAVLALLVSVLALKIWSPRPPARSRADR